MDWNSIRPWKGSQNSAFEELCCQLAAHEHSVPVGSHFVRKGIPDAGVECYWQLADGNEWGWQAKFFLASPESEQWGQIDGSVKTAIEKHPRLVRYYICLPIDRSDARLDNQTSCLEKWHEHVTKWAIWTSSRGMKVELLYWGNHEIGDRLTLTAHRGRRLFWFGKEEFSSDWYASRFTIAIENIGPKYITGLNVDLPIARIFKAFGRTESFFEQFKGTLPDIKNRWRKVLADKLVEEAGIPFEKLKEQVDNLLELLGRISFLDSGPIPWEEIHSAVCNAREYGWTCTEKLQEILTICKEKTKDKSVLSQDSDGYTDAIYMLHQFIGELEALKEYSDSCETLVTNCPALLVYGEAGEGKTHLFCTAAKEYLAAGYPAILLHGRDFDRTEPWAQIIRQIGLNCNLDDFLGALQTDAETRGGRAIIFIDALNEGEGKSLWKRYLSGMLSALAEYPQVGLAISVRSSYIKTIIPDTLTAKKLPRIRHDGFLGYENEATKVFFEYYKIERPAIPLLTPEFSRPLFLHLFCNALHKQKLTRIPPGLSGMSAIFDLYLEAINQALAESIGFDPADHIVQQAVGDLARQMAQLKMSWLSRDAAKVIVDRLLPERTYRTSLFKALLSEDLLTENMHWDREIGSEVVSFTYERFCDHKICDELLREHVSGNDIEGAFEIQQPLGQLLTDEQSAWKNKGFIEALAIQVPESFGKELPDVAPYARNFAAVRLAVVESFLWRQKDSFSKLTLKYLNDAIIQDSESNKAFLETLLIIATNPVHPYNARFLHNRLMRQSLPDRDSDWTMSISTNLEKHRVRNRLIDWAWSDEDKKYVSDESMLLCAMVISWFLASPDRFLRDKSTKALVNLLTPRIYLLEELVKLFEPVNDPYVWERVMAVAYGCSLRSRDAAGIARLAEIVFKSVFVNNIFHKPNVLIRDYGRGVIERAINLGASLSFDPNLARPPYRSALPVLIPSESDLEKYGRYTEGMSDSEHAQLTLYGSILNPMEDFSCYVIGTGLTAQWLNRQIGSKPLITAKDKYSKFVSDLSPEEGIALEAYEKELFRIVVTGMEDAPQSRRIAFISPVKPEKKCSKSTQKKNKKLNQLFRVLTMKNRKLFKTEAQPYLENPQASRNALNFDIRPYQRWMFQRVLDLGWTVERFSAFDRIVDSHYTEDPRTGHKAERMGKKYQWIAFYEMLAFLTDNFELRAQHVLDEPESYSGPWQFNYGRNIDPSCVLKGNKSLKGIPPAWWSPQPYDGWFNHKDDLLWTNELTDFPNPANILEVKNPEDGSSWLVLKTSLTQDYVIPEGGTKRRQLWYMAQSYLVKQTDIPILKPWSSKQNYWGHWMPEGRSLSDVFLGEYYWAPSYIYHDSEYFGASAWTSDAQYTKVPVPILPVSESYESEGNGVDCSAEQGLSIYLPNKLIADMMHLDWHGVAGKFFDAEGNLIAFDPSVYKNGPKALLVKKDAFCSFLNREGYSLFWTFVGQKLVLGDESVRRSASLELSGTYWLNDASLDGELTSRFQPPVSR